VPVVSTRFSSETKTLQALAVRGLLVLRGAAKSLRERTDQAGREQALPAD